MVVNYFYLILLVSGLIALTLTVILFQKDNPVTKSFSFIMLSISIWALAYSIELTQNTLEQMMFWIRIEYIGIGSLPACWILFAIYYTGKKKLLNKKILIPIFLISATTTLMVWTNNLHHLHYKSVSIDATGPTPLLAISTGIWYWIHTVFFYGMLVWGIALIISKYKGTNKLYKRQTMIILIGAMVPWIINLIYLLGFRPYDHIDLTPYGFMATALIISFGLIRYKLFGLVPLARTKALKLMQEGFVVLDSKNRILDLNETMRQILDINNNELLKGTNFFDIWPDEKLFLAINKRRGEKILLRKTNEKDNYYFEVSVNPFGQRYDEEEGTLLLFWDITRHKQDAQRLTEQATNLEELNSLKDKLISIISHDLRSPMASLKQMLDMIDQDIITESYFNDLLPKLSKNLKNTTELMDNLLNWAKSQLEGGQVEPEIFNIFEVINKNIALMESVADNKEINFKVEGDESHLVYADENMIDLVIRNLLSNAIKFSKENSEITINVKQEQNNLLISIKDRGVGIPASSISHLFRNTSISTMGTQNEKGTGIGLMLCKDFIDKNGGTIWAESIKNQGSTFNFTLPLATMQLVSKLMGQTQNELITSSEQNQYLQ